MYSNDRDVYRQTFYIAWQKHLKNSPLEPVEAQLVAVILQHPEYQKLIEQADSLQKQEFELEENPFFHMSLHMGIHEQLQTNRPQGIQHVYRELLKKYVHAHDVEHMMMDCLAKMLWRAQQAGVMGSDDEYLEELKKL